MQIRLFVLLLALSLLAGCGGAPIKETPKSGAPSNIALDRLVAYDFVNVLVQVNGYHPDNATLEMMNPDNQFGSALERVLREANYDVQTVETQSDKPLVDYSVVDNGDQSFTYTLSVGQVFIERKYKKMDNGKVLPSSDLLVDGVDASLISLQDSQPFKLNIPARPTTEVADAPVELESVPLASEIEQSENLTEPVPFQSVSSASENPIDDSETTENNASAVSDSSFTVLVNGDESLPGYSEGETLVFSLLVQRDARVSCYFQDPDDNVMRMYPNSFVSNAQLAAGDTVLIPSNDQWSIHATRSGTKDEVLCVSVQPVYALAMDKFDSSPDFEVMAYKSLDELLVNLSASIGINPENKRVSINVY